MTFEPKFLTSEQVEALHKLQIDQFGGAHGVRDDGLLLSALAQPEAGYGDLYDFPSFLLPDVFGATL